jgi:transposase
LGQKEVGRMAEYSHRFRMKMVRRMVGPNACSASALAAETGVSQPTLSRWLRDAGTVTPMSEATPKPMPPKPGPKRPEDWTAEERLEAVIAARGLEGEALGAFLRQRGLHASDIDTWRQAALASLDGTGARRRPTGEGKRVRQLEAELRRKEKALAETAALLVLQGKARALWGEEGTDTKAPNGRRS